MHRVPRMVAVDQLTPNPRNARTHSRKQVRMIADSIQAFGFTAPILMDEKGVLLAGHGRLEAARLLGLSEVPAVELSGLSEAKKRALLLADNKLAEKAGWDRERLALELPELRELLVEEGLEILVTGFEPVEIDQIETDFEQDASDPADEIVPAWGNGPAVTAAGDLWVLGNHRLLCGDARSSSDMARLMGEERAAMAFLDPPYNVQIKSIVGRGRTKHKEFAMAAGEMTPAAFTAFLVAVLREAAAISCSGAVHFVCMDWRHITELIEAGRQAYAEMLNLVVWAKSNAGQGSFYRSQHELVGVFRVGNDAHLNNIELGRHGRRRSNIWHYAGVNSFRPGRMEELGAHPTVKPAALVADAMKDCTRRGDAVLDSFSGSGTTMMAAERVGRRAFALELEPGYVDVAVRRWQAFTGRDAVHAESGENFDDIAAERAGTADPRTRSARPRRAAR
ncbi:MAG: ParB N-terminal domain-containing protein [Rhizobiales bacterium]|nr:ParB N-terminal domain-containing protein [Hyphomicrobiales bacterium]